MKRYLFCITIIAFLLLSCSKTKQGELLEIPIDIHPNSSLLLSEIAEEITAIELELTDKSMINTGYIQRIIVAENEIIIATLSQILVFNKEGKFIRSIGSRGQGPGEYNYILNLGIDEKNKRLFIISSPDRKIISYDLKGNFLKEIAVSWSEPQDINYINKELLLLADKVGDDSNGVYSNSSLYWLNDDLRVVDSCTIRNLYLDGVKQFVWGRESGDIILEGNKS
ncbi:MAG: 6-bladed beta-propeller, partial [Dysgonamonadaceae bacterium]|nr:6-bladed beta-propeller [Dysgonamonadaceae bacterium]